MAPETDVGFICIPDELATPKYEVARQRGSEVSRPSAKILPRQQGRQGINQSARPHLQGCALPDGELELREQRVDTIGIELKQR